MSEPARIADGTGPEAGAALHARTSVFGFAYTYAWRFR